MSAAQYSIYLCDPFGVRLGDASGFTKLQYTRVVNDVGALKLWLPADFDTNLIRIPDGRIEVWRRLPGSSREYLDTDTVWLIKAIQWDRDDTGNVSLLVEATTPLQILKERFVDGPIISVVSQIAAGASDDQIKIVAFQNGIGTNATYTYSAADQGDGGRIGAYVSVENLRGLGASLPRWDTAWQKLLTVMQTIAGASTQSGVYLAFDIVAPTPNTLELRTYTQQRGVDHRYPNGINPIIFGGQLSNAGQATLRLDYSKEITYVSAVLQGIIAGYFWDNTRIDVSPFGRRMAYVVTQADPATLNDVAAWAVRYGRARNVYQGRILSTPNTLYGLHWGWGDFVTVQDFGQSFDCRVEAVSVSVDDNKETITAIVKSD